jgi:hypothetical protein
VNQRLLRLWIAHRVSVRVDANGRRAERGARRDQKRRELAAGAANDEEVLRRQTQRWLRGDGRIDRLAGRHAAEERRTVDRGIDHTLAEPSGPATLQLVLLPLPPLPPALPPPGPAGLLAPPQPATMAARTSVSLAIRGIRSFTAHVSCASVATPIHNGSPESIRDRARRCPVGTLNNS